ncbi:hypothetical protein [Nonomuraea typhae]|uniref:Minor tail protein n=1 Tax=Nonomuraea typhae TaxID=2603600 RepID=A0ABW7YMQ9_9ACTN
MRKGPFSEQVIVVVPDDDTPPSAPSAPAVSTRLGMIHVAWDGMTATGTAMPTDLDRVNVWMADPLAPGSAQVVDSMRGAETVVVGGQPYNADRELWLTAVDRSGNESASSGRVTIATKPLVDTDLIGKILSGANIIAGTVNAADAVIANTVTGNLIQANAINTGHLQANAVTTPVLAAGAVTAGKLESVLTLSTRIVAGNPNAARVELNSTGIRAYNANGVDTVNLSTNGTFTLRSAATGARVQLDNTGFKAFNVAGQQTVDIGSTGNVSLIGQISSGTSGRRIEVSPLSATDPEIRFYSDDGLNYVSLVSPSGRTLNDPYLDVKTPNIEGRESILHMEAGTAYFANRGARGEDSAGIRVDRSGTAQLMGKTGWISIGYDAFAIVGTDKVEIFANGGLWVNGVKIAPL